MLDALKIFTRGGVVLWSHQVVAELKGDPVGQLIRIVFLEERSGEVSAFFDPFHLKWRFFSNLVVVAVYSGFQSVALIEALLDSVLTEFVKHTTFLTTAKSLKPAAASSVVFDVRHRCSSAATDFTPAYERCLRDSSRGGRAWRARR
eukprot:Selendium_serpulae@DN5953_c0_g1_i1.p1